MIDVSDVLELIRARRAPAIRRSVEDSPSEDDVLERSAFLEFCEGLNRTSADSQALGEFGFDSWEGLRAMSDPSAERIEASLFNRFAS